MRVKIGNFPEWVGPYQIADKIFFWCEKYPEDESVEKRWDYRSKDWLGEFLAHGFEKETPEQKKKFLRHRHQTWFAKLCEWIHSKQKRKVVIKLDPWDTWNMDATVAMLVLPMLKQLKATSHSYATIHPDDVPEHLRFVEHEEYDCQECFDFYRECTDKLKVDSYARYEWFIDELIWTFEQLQPDYDWEEQYTKGEIDIDFVTCEDNPSLSTMVDGPNHTFVVDWEARNKHQARINEGLRLFGKYYNSLWD